MAYLNFSEFSAGAPPSADARGVAEPAGFSATEWMVISLARTDPLHSLSQPGRVERAMRSLFGLGARSRLADERLERLRRLAVLVWHQGWRLPTSEIKAFLAEFSAAQLETLVAAIGRAKDGRSRRTAAWN